MEQNNSDSWRCAHFLELSNPFPFMYFMQTMDVLDVRDDIINWYERVGYKRTGVHIDATEFFLDKGEDLLVSSNFILLEKDLVP